MKEYVNFAELAKKERKGVDYRISTRRRKGAALAIVAPHGGGIEPGTSEIAEAIAGNDCSFAAFIGIKRSGNKALHVTSTNFDEPRCLKVVRDAQNVVAIHGEDSDREVVFLGGKNEELAGKIRTALEQHGFKVEKHPDPGLQGVDDSNVCNRGIGKAGVQLELSNGLRKRFFKTLDAAGREWPTDGLGVFATVVREGLGRGTDGQGPTRGKHCDL